jgi:6-hydroxy-3-succinoylpyridine 3-monooxygenase
MGAFFLRGEEKMKRSSIVYIDGFNLYYNALKDTKYKWLNLQKCFELIRTDDIIQEVKYFTSLLSPGWKREHQKLYIGALSTLSKVQIFYGKFKTKDIECQVPDCRYDGLKTFCIPVEKRTDVNIASHFVADTALRVDIDNLILVSGDSDLVPAIQTARIISPEKRIIVYVPIPENPLNELVSSEIRKAADTHRNLPWAAIKNAQLEPVIVDETGRQFTKPECW